MASETAGAEIDRAALRPALIESPLLLALAAAPLVVGYLEAPLPALWFSCLVWAALALRCLAGGLPPPRAPRASWLVVGLPALAALSFVTSANRGATVFQFTLFATCAAVLWLSADSASRGGAPRLMAAMLLGALIVAGMALQEWGLHARYGDLGWRAFGPFTNQNFLAGYLVPALLLTLGLAFHKPESFRNATWLLALGLLTAALTAAVMVSGSRGGLVSLGVGLGALLVYGAARGPLREKAVWARFGPLLAVAVVVFLVFFGALRNRYTAMTGTAGLPAELCPHEAKSQAGESAAFRIKTWEASARMGLKRPLLGWGAGAFDTAFAPHQIAGFTRHAHNTPLQMLAELGLPGALLWVALLACGLLVLFRAPREWYWAAGAGAALTASGVHNLFDSLYYVPAIGFLVSALTGMALCPTPELAARMDAGAGGPSARSHRGRPAVPTRRIPRLPKGVLLAIAAGGLGLCLTQAVGRVYLDEAGSLILSGKYAEAVDRLASAQTLLPWDHEVADLQRDAYLYVGRPEEAVAAARRALEITPERPSAYYYLGQIREGLREDAVARDQYGVGLEHAPKEVRLLMAHALASERLGEREAALEDYRKIVELAESPVGTLRALSEVLDYRYARARMELARDAMARGNREEAVLQRRTAACFLAQRRELFAGAPAAYQSTGDFAPGTERELRRQEASLWTDLAQEFRRRGDNRLADLSTEQAEKASKSLDRLAEIFKDFGVE